MSEALGLRKNILRIKFTHREKTEVRLRDRKVLSVARYNAQPFIAKFSEEFYARNRTKGDTSNDPHLSLSTKEFNF